MEATQRCQIPEEEALSHALDKGIDDMESGKLTPHEDSMRLLRQQLNDYVLQNQGN